MPKPGGEVVCRGLWVVPIAFDHHRAFDPNFAHFTGGQFATVGVHHPHVGACQGLAHGVVVGGSVALGHQGGWRGGFGRAIAIHQHQARHFDGEFFDGGDRHGCAAVGTHAPGGQVDAVKLGAQHAQVVHGRHHQGMGHALALGQLQKRRSFELRHDDQLARAQHQGGDQSDQASHMAQGHGGHRTVLRAQAHGNLVVHGRVHQAQVGEHGALGPTGGARGVQNHRRVFFVHRRHVDQGCMRLPIGIQRRARARSHGHTMAQLWCFAWRG